MVRRRRGGAGALATRGVVFVCIWLLPACGKLLGLDQGMALVGESDASSDATMGVAPGDETAAEAPDGSEGPGMPEGTSPNDGSNPPDRPDSGAPQADAGRDAGCSPDPGWCGTHCGTGPDNCGASRQCQQCTGGYACGAGNVCVCQNDPGWCTGRCGQVYDNCGKAINCGSCMSNQCQPESIAAACGSKQCGQATNNCNQTINCGLFGLTSQCLNQQVCLADGGCCTPNGKVACGKHCGGTVVTDNCGNPFPCTTCNPGEVCNQNTCCTPTDPCGGACGVTHTNNCGQTVQCGCPAGAECLANNTCCVPQGCSANCVDSCGIAAASCCVDAGPEAGPPEAGMDEAGSDLEGGSGD